MSEVAGKIATQAGAFILEKPLGGRGILLGGVPGVRRGEGRSSSAAASSGMNAALIAIGMEAEVTVFDRNIDRLRWVDVVFGGRARHVLRLDAARSREHLAEADLVIGAVLVPGARAPQRRHREQLGLMKRHAVLVDVAIDQGGCFETSRPTTHTDPTYEVDGVIHYCVANMPGAVPVTSTYALTNATLPYVRRARRTRRPARAAARDPGFLARASTSPAGPHHLRAGRRRDRAALHAAGRGAAASDALASVPAAGRCYHPRAACRRRAS